MICCSIAFTESYVDCLENARLILQDVQGLNSVAPIPYLDTVATALMALVDKLKKTSSDHAGLMAVAFEVLDLVKTIEATITTVHQTIGGRRNDLEDLMGSSKLRTSVEKLVHDIEALIKKADELDRGPWGLHRMFLRKDVATLEDLQEGIRNCKEYFKTNCQVGIKGYVEEVAKIILDQEEEAIRDFYDRYDKTLDHLPHAEASYRAVVNAKHSNFLPGTRVELFEKINDWVEGRSEELSGKAVCILLGDAGADNSTIAFEFARQRDEEGDYGASFFFVRGEADLDSTQLVFPTLAYQLAQSQGALRPHIIRAAREHLKRGRIQQMKFQAPELLHGPIHQISNDHPRMVLVIDALDECSKETCKLVPEMLDRLIETVHHAQFPLRIFFTSRPNSLIQDTLQRPKWTSLVHTISLHDLPLESVQQDMAIFIRNEIMKIPSGQVLLQQRPDVADRLAERAGGLFVYAKTTMDFLGDYPGFVEDGLDKLLSEGSSSFATALQPLDDLYLTVLETAFPSNELSRDLQLRQALESTLGSLAVLHNPLSPTVLEELTGVPRWDICSVLSRLRAVVLFDEMKPDEKVRVMHDTFSQFLLDANRCMSPWYRVDARRQHALLAAGCLRVLQALENMCRLPDAAFPRADVPYSAERLARYVNEHVQYACVHWAAHLLDACEVGKHIENESERREIGARLTAFARTKLQAWVEVIAYMGRLDTVKDSLGAARTYLKGTPQYQEVDSLFVGVQWLVVDHYSEIEECPYNVHEIFRSSVPVRDIFVPSRVDSDQTCNL